MNEDRIPRPSPGRLRTGSYRRPRAVSRHRGGGDTATVAGRNAPRGQPYSQYSGKECGIRCHSASFTTERYSGLSQVAGSDCGYRPCPDSFTIGSAVGSLDIEADVDHTCLMARHHFPWLQRTRAAQRYYVPRFDRFGACRRRRYFSDPRVG
jgi:hypothetical protein